MKTIFLKLQFESPDVRSTAGNAWIVPGDHSIDKGGWPLLTPHCASLGEIEWHIDQMQKELEEIRRQARRKFADAAAKPPSRATARRLEREYLAPEEDDANK